MSRRRKRRAGFEMPEIPYATPANEPVEVVVEDPGKVLRRLAKEAAAKEAAEREAALRKQAIAAVADHPLLTVAGLRDLKKLLDEEVEDMPDIEVEEKPLMGQQIDDNLPIPDSVRPGQVIVHHFDADTSIDGYWITWERRKRGYAGIIASLVVGRKLTEEELKNDNGVFTCAVVPRVEKRIEAEGLKFDYESALLVALEELPE